jgi:hypothetical protein
LGLILQNQGSRRFDGMVVRQSQINGLVKTYKCRIFPTPVPSSEKNIAAGPNIRKYVERIIVEISLAEGEGSLINMSNVQRRGKSAIGNRGFKQVRGRQAELAQERTLPALEAN